MEEFEAEVFEKDELENQNIPELEAIKPFVAYQDSNSNVRNKLNSFRKETVLLK